MVGFLPAMRKLLLGICLVPVLATCSTGGSRADFDLKKVPGTPVFESEKDYASVIVGKRYRLLNNVWNKGATSGRYRQKIFVNDDGGKPVFGWVWKWRDSTGVVAYPEVQAGVSPWNGEASADSGFPFRVGTKKLTVSYDVDLQATGAYNLAFEFWVVTGQPITKDVITHEVMIWVASDNLGAAGSEVAKATIAGHNFSVNKQEGHGDDSGGVSNTWTIISLLSDQPILHGPLDVGAIIEYLVQQHLIDSRLWIANFELGDEVQRGAGMTIVRNYAVTVE
jgi:Glycosyl hydrolase family 12